MKAQLQYKQTIDQLYFVAHGSLLIVVFCVCFAAMVTILESSFHMKLVIQNDSLVPGFASMLILRELAVVVMSLLLTARVGAGMAAEVGTMKVTEQLEALQMLGISRMGYIVVPRLIACTLGAICLAVIANMACLFTAMLISEVYLGFTSGLFISAMVRFVSMKDFVFSIIKATFFGATIPLVCCFFGFRCKIGAEGVGLATTNSVVASSVAIIIIDFILTYLFSYF